MMPGVSTRRGWVSHRWELVSTRPGDPESSETQEAHEDSSQAVWRRAVGPAGGRGARPAARQWDRVGGEAARHGRPRLRLGHGVPPGGGPGQNWAVALGLWLRRGSPGRWRLPVSSRLSWHIGDPFPWGWRRAACDSWGGPLDKELGPCLGFLEIPSQIPTNAVASSSSCGPSHRSGGRGPSHRGVGGSLGACRAALVPRPASGAPASRSVAMPLQPASTCVWVSDLPASLVRTPLNRCRPRPKSKVTSSQDPKLRSICGDSFPE